MTRIEFKRGIQTCWDHPDLSLTASLEHDPEAPQLLWPEEQPAKMPRTRKTPGTVFGQLMGCYKLHARACRECNSYAKYKETETEALLGLELFP